MRTYVDREKFEDVLGKAKQVVERKISMLSRFKLTADEGKVYVYATDLQNFLVFEVPARVEVKGETSVDADKIRSVVKSSAEVYMELVEGKLIVKGGRSQFRLVCADPSEFPEFPQAVVTLFYLKQG